MTTPNVQYGYADGSENSIRPVSLTYPNGRVITYDYGAPGEINDASSRVEKIVDDDDTVLAQYEYLGLGTPITVDYTEPQVKYTLMGTAGGNDPDTGDIYRGLDRFGRVKDSYWYDYGSLTEAARIQYGYDRASSRTYRKDPVAESYGKGLDELYTHDRLSRIREMVRGTLDINRTSVHSPTFSQCWSLDVTGNWTRFRQDSDGAGSWDLIQRRAVDPANEIIEIETVAGPAWANPAYDAAANMTTLPQPQEPAIAYFATYDAWNKAVMLREDTGSGPQPVAEHAYDARGYRLSTALYSTGILLESRHQYYSRAWQVLEQRVAMSPDAANADRQFVWGTRYIDNLLLRDRDSSLGGTLSERMYGLQDGNWNIVGITDENGDVQERYTYEPYGNVRFLSSSFVSRSSSSYKWETLFCGYQLGGDALFAVRHRDLNSAVGTWMERDPFGYADTMNLYEYQRSHPVTGTDPSGRESQDMWATDNNPSLFELRRNAIKAEMEKFFASLKGKFTPIKTGKNKGKCPLTLCEALAMWLDTYSAIVDDFNQFGAYGANVGGLADVGGERIGRLFHAETGLGKNDYGQPKAEECTHQCWGFKGDFAGNGQQNLRHFVSTMFFGMLGTTYDTFMSPTSRPTQFQKLNEQFQPGTTDNMDRIVEILAQMKANLISYDVYKDILKDLDANNNSWFTTDRASDAAWKVVGPTMGARWRKNFCR